MQKTMMGNTANSNASSIMKLKKADVILLGDEKGMTWLLDKLGAKTSSIFVSLSKKVQHIIEEPERQHTASITLDVQNTTQFKHYNLPVINKCVEAAIIVYNVTDTGLYDSSMKWVKDLQEKGRQDIIVSLLGYNDTDSDDPWVSSMNAMRIFGQRTGISIHTVVNTSCSAIVVHEMLTEISRAIYAARACRDEDVNLPDVQGVFPSSLIEINRSLKITPVLDRS
ncbi:uncharacterized protein [Amphiura filiformis]|uniref:uncharacterized protein n=1 Tax=Amphiura filiformis TaxID=82378 RepID=UPI003B218E32